MSSWFKGSFFQNTVGTLLILLGIYTVYAISPLLSATASFFTTIIYPFFLALIFYYLLRPFVRNLTRWIPLPLAILASYILLGIIFTFIVLFVYPTIVEQINLLKSINYTTEAHEYLGIQPHMYGKISSFIESQLTNITTLITTGLLNVITALTEFVISFAVSFFILFYYLKDDRQIYTRIHATIPQKFRDFYMTTTEELDLALFHFINGRFFVSAIVSTFVFFTFLYIGINYLFTITFFCFLFYIIPTLGSFLAIIMPLLIGLSMGSNMALEVLFIMGIAATLEGFVITPLVMGKALYIHPLTMILILLASGSLYGFFGLLFVTPLYAIAKIIILRLYEFKQRASQPL